MPNALAMGMCRISTIGLCLAAWLVPAAAATLEQLAFEELAQKSTSIVRAKVVDSQASFRGPEIFTRWKLTVTQQFKGPATDEVMAPGGSARGFRQSVPGSPQLTVGKEYILFLWTSKSGATYLTGWSQGVFELSTDGNGKIFAKRASAGETMVERGTWRPVNDSAMELPLNELTARIAASGGKR